MGEIELGQYIVERLKQLDVKQVFGLPGDYNLDWLDFIEKDKDIHWVGSTNELNASYAADGYARVKHSLGVVVTTFGVGELSALNGIAGAMSERVPILHLVGVPSTSLQANKAILHHTLGGSGTFNSFAEMSSHISSAVGILKKNTDWTTEIDRVLTCALTECRPVYLTLPTDLVHAKVSDAPLRESKLPRPHSAPISDELGDESTQSDVLKHCIVEISERFEKSKNPIVVVDICADRFGCGPELKKLVEATGVRFFATPMGKSVLDEDHTLFGGTYAGANSLPAVRQEIENADFVLMAGKLESDFNSGSFTFQLPVKDTVELHSFETKIGYASYPECDIRTILPHLTRALGQIVKKNGGPKQKDEKLIEKSKKQREELGQVPEPDSKAIKHDWFWPRIGAFLQPNDIVIGETGTSSFGLVNVPFPKNGSCLTQTLWGSIGWATGATMGAVLAANEAKEKRRTILFTGDGSIQLTLQEVGTMIRRKTCPYLFVLNNDGYEIERQIHGPKAEYNDIMMYDWQKMLPFFAGKSTHPYQSFEVHTPAELDELLNDKEFNVADKLRLIEVYMPRGDAPAGLIRQAQLTAEANSKI